METSSGQIQKPDSKEQKPASTPAKSNMGKKQKLNPKTSEPALITKKAGGKSENKKSDGPKKAKIAKLDEASKKVEKPDKKQKVKEQNGDSAKQVGKEKKGSQFEKKKKKKKNIKKNRMGKNKFKRLKKLLGQ